VLSGPGCTPRGQLFERLEEQAEKSDACWDLMFQSSEEASKVRRAACLVAAPPAPSCRSGLATSGSV